MSGRVLNQRSFRKIVPTIRPAIEAKMGAANVTYAPGTRITRGAGRLQTAHRQISKKKLTFPQLSQLRKTLTSSFFALGEGSYCETPGTISDLTLGEPQLRLAEAIVATGKPVVIVLAEGRPRIINRIVDSASAIVMAYNPGNEGGQAIADALFGDINPSGKLPFTYPRTVNGLLSYDHRAFETQGNRSLLKPQFEFGDGLSYTTFGYSDLRLNKQVISVGDKLTVNVTLTNRGKRAGKEVVQLYVTDLVASIAPAGKRLRRFAKIYLEPNQRRTLNFSLRREDLSFIGNNNKPVAEPGDFEVTIGGMKSEI